ncbi:MAG: cyanophycin synthetase [Xanthomonadales bacterium]|nr:cyanophycin synthetase [Xanthomonadales bacterium]
MQITKTNIYRGPNHFALFPVIRQVIDLGELEAWPSVKLGDSFIEALTNALPGLAQHGCSYREPGGFLRRLTEDEGTWLGHVYEHVVIELQCMAGFEVTFGRTRSIDGQSGVYNVVYEYASRDVGLAAGELGLDLLLALLPESLQPEDAEPFDWPERRDEFIRYAQRRALGPSTASLVAAATDRGIPHLRLNEHSLVQLGHGKYQERIQATITSKTPHIAVELACDKEETHRILEDLGLPVPKQMLVRSAEGAVRAARRIGFPVVLKPFNGNHGRGVSINLTSEEQVESAFEQANKHSRSVIVESYIQGLDHRLLVVNGQLVAAAKRVPGHVVGDGESTIEALVAEVNADPRRGIGHEKVLTRIEFDHQAERLLAQRGYDRNSIPPEGEVVYLRSTANLSTGGTAVDVTDVIHPDNRAMAIRAAQAIGLDVGGIDFLTTDITESYRTTGGAICEVNAAPGFRMHVAPSEGKPRDVAGPVMDMLFPAGKPTRIPIAAITGTNGKTTTSRMLAHILKLAGHTVGMTTTEGVYIDGKLTYPGDMTGPGGAAMVLRDPTVDAAVMETARGGLVKRGMGIDQSNVSACLNIAEDHLGRDGIDTLDDLARVKRTVVEVATDTAVLNADDSHCLKMAAYTKAAHLCYVTMNSNHSLVKQHIRAGGRAVVLEQGLNGQMIALYDNGTHTPLVWTHLIPATIEGRALHNVQNAMFAAALAHGMGISRENIEHGLRTFATSFFQAPGRMNVFDEHPFKVIMDYAHNAAGVAAMSQLVDSYRIAGRKHVVLAAPGDRRDDDIRSIAAAAAGHFDHYICRRDDALRGRDEEEVPNMLREVLLEHGVPDEAIDIVPLETEAIDAALGAAEPGDLVVIFADTLARSWKQIIYFEPDRTTKPTRPEKPRPVEEPVSAPSVANPWSMEEIDEAELIHDERGVWLAREEND